MSSNPKNFSKRIDSTKYANVTERVHQISGEIFYQANKRVKNKRYCISGKTAREAALKLDMKLISLGEEPINILKRTTKPLAIN